MRATCNVSIHDCVQSKVMCSTARNLFWSKNDDSESNSFVGILELYTYRTVTLLRWNTTVAYPIHVLFQNFEELFRRLSIDHRHTLQASLLVWTFKNIFGQKKCIWNCWRWGASQLEFGSSLRWASCECPWIFQNLQKWEYCMNQCVTF